MRAASLALLLVALGCGACNRAPPEPLGETRSSGAPAVSASATSAGALGLPRAAVQAVARRERVAPVMNLPSEPAPADVSHPDADALAVGGLRYKLLRRGAHATPHRPWDTVVLRYTLWGLGGSMSSTRAFGSEDSVTFASEDIPYEFAKPAALLEEGDMARFWFSMKSGDQDAPVLADVQLLSVHRMPEPPAPPRDLRAAPHGASTAGGVQYVTLVRSRACATRPKPTDVVAINITGWQPDGARFVTTTGKTPVQIALASLPSEWTEILRGMCVGDTDLLWVPEQLGGALRNGPFSSWPWETSAVVRIELVAIAPQPSAPVAP